MMTYAEYLRKVRKHAAGQRNPYLCYSNEAVCGWNPTLYDHQERLRGAIDKERTREDGYMYAFIVTRWMWDGVHVGSEKKARISWLTKQIKLADAETAGLIKTK